MKAILTDCQTNNRPIIFASRRLVWFHELKKSCAIAMVCFTEILWWTIVRCSQEYVKEISCVTTRVELFPKMLWVIVSQNCTFAVKGNSLGWSGSLSMCHPSILGSCQYSMWVDIPYMPCVDGDNGVPSDSYMWSNWFSKWKVTTFTWIYHSSLNIIFIHLYDLGQYD